MPKRNKKSITPYRAADFRRTSKSLQCRRKWKKRKTYTRSLTQSDDLDISIDGILGNTSFNFDPELFNQFNSSRESCTENCTVVKAVQTDQLNKIRFAVAAHVMQLGDQYLSANVQMDDRYDISTVSNSQAAFKHEVNIARNILATSGGLQRDAIFDSISRCLKYLTELMDLSHNIAIEVGAELNFLDDFFATKSIDDKCVVIISKALQNPSTYKSEENIKILNHILEWTRETAYGHLVDFFHKTAVFLIHNWSADAEIELANGK